MDSNDVAELHDLHGCEKHAARGRRSAGQGGGKEITGPARS
jgi:hypothetical protein